MSTFTEFCAVKDGVAYCGSKSDIVHRVCEYISISIGHETRKLAFKVKGFEEDSRVGFTPGWTFLEMQIEAITHIWGKLEKEYGFTVYRRTL